MVVPKLRFKEFNDEWKTYNLKQVVEIRNGLNKEKESFGSGTPIINYMDVNKNEILTSDKIKGLVKLSEKEIDNFRVKKGDIFFTRTSETSDEIGLSSSLIEDINDCVFSGFVLKATPITNILNPLFSGYYFRTYKLRKEIIKHSSITTRALTSGSLLYGMNINIPNVNEQEKIGKLLQLLDKKIELQQKKIEALKIYKMGLSKKLFDKNSNTNFKDCFSHFGGTALEEYVTENATYNFISIGNYSPEGTYIDNGQRINNIEKAKDKILNRNDLVMVLNDKTSQGNIIGSTILIDADNKYIYNQRSERIKCNFNIIPKYAWCILNSTNIRNTIFKKSQGGTQIYINFHEIENLKLYVPPIEEQIKLSNVYYSIISKLNIENQKLNYLNTMKKSLLQQMFI